MNHRRLIAYLAAAVAAVTAMALITITLHFLGRSAPPQVRHITNGSQRQRLGFQTSDEHPSGVTFRVRGHIYGTATISTIEQPSAPHPISGDVDWSVRQDWYFSTCTFDYAPERGTSGQLTFELSFH